MWFDGDDDKNKAEQQDTTHDIEPGDYDTGPELDVPGEHKPEDDVAQAL